MRRIKRFVLGEEAATAVEYAFLLSLILMALIASVASVGTVLHDSVFDSSAKLGKAMSTSS